jgi:hypothetical protein
VRGGGGVRRDNEKGRDIPRFHSMWKCVGSRVDGKMDV